MPMKFEDSPVNLLAKEVAKVFGGTHIPLGPDKEYYEGWANVEVPACQETPAYTLHLSLKGYGADKNKVYISLNPIKIDHDVSNYGLTFPKAGFDITRDFQSICSGISKRLVNAQGSFDAIREYETRVQAMEDSKKSLEDHWQDVQKNCPSVQTSSHTRDTHQIRIYSRGGVSWDGTLSHNGTVSFDRIYSIPLEKAKRIWAILAE